MRRIPVPGGAVGARWRLTRARTTRRGAAALRGIVTALVAVAGAVGLTGCVDEKIVYRDRELFQQPSAAAANFLGYRDTTAKATTCGSCHVSAQGQWSRTAHADAWKTLADLPAAQRQPFCEACHTVGQNGNAAPNPQVGWTSTRDLRYKDVQCESCHGPGLQHVQDPSRANLPLASLASDSTRKDGCGGCHSGAHHPFANEWQQSSHGTMAAWSASGPNTRADCQGCHTGQGALQMWGVDTRSNYKEKGLMATQPLRITCGVCHDPHSAENGRPQLRLSINVADEQRNLCMSCHHKRGEPDLGTAGTSTRGAHSPEGPMLLGEAGWWPPGMEVPGGLERITTSHGSQRNPRMCAGCHVEKYEVRDKVTNAFVMNVTGHRFLAVPCVDANGVPTRAQDCGDNLPQRRFTSCATSGCHASQDQARSAYVVARTRIATLNATLKAQLARVPRTEFSGTDNRFTMAEGAQFNTTLADKVGSWVHNPFLMEALLTASISGVRTTYNIAPAATVSLQNTFLAAARAPAPSATLAASAAPAPRATAPAVGRGGR